MNALNLSPHDLRHPADIQESLASLQAELARLLGDAAPAPSRATRRRRKLGAQGLANIRQETHC